MAYSVDRLGTIEECDTLLQYAQKEKDDLEYTQGALEHRMESYQDRSVKHEADLTAVTTELASLQTVFDGLDPGDLKDDIESRIKRLEYRQWLLQERSDTYGVLALLEKEMEIERIVQEIAEVDIFIAEVEVRKAAL